jgi:hypothetical protein
MVRQYDGKIASLSLVPVAEQYLRLLHSMQQQFPRWLRLRVKTLSLISWEISSLYVQTLQPLRLQ